jgi:hypothetical protein
LVCVAARPPQPTEKPAPQLLESLPDDRGREQESVILVTSCAKYSSLWEPFFTLFKRYWPDCPYRVVLGTDKGSYPGIESIELGYDRGWSSNCREFFSRLTTAQVLLFQDDFFLRAPVHTEIVRKIFRLMLEGHAGMVRLYPHPPPSGASTISPDLGSIAPLDSFRGSFQLTLWKRSLYPELLADGEDPWATEFAIGQRSIFHIEPFLGVRRNPPIHYLSDAIVGGSWSEEAVQMMHKEGIPCKGGKVS